MDAAVADKLRDINRQLHTDVKSLRLQVERLRLELKFYKSLYADRQAEMEASVAKELARRGRFRHQPTAANRSRSVTDLPRDSGLALAAVGGSSRSTRATDALNPLHQRSDDQ